MKKRIMSFALCIVLCACMLTGACFAEAQGAATLTLDAVSAQSWQGEGVVSIKNFETMPQLSYISGQFTDVDENAWYGANQSGAIKTAYELSIVNGRGGGIFDPTGSVQLSEAIKMAAVVNSIYYGGNGVMTADAGEEWYAPYVDYCISQKVISSSDFGGNYDRPATRAEMAYIFANALPESELTAINDITEIPDVDSSTDYCSEIYKMYRAGALQGSDAYGTFSPNANISRAETTAIISRIALTHLRLSFTLEKQAELYTPYMTVNDMAQVEAVYKERVWGLYNDMYITVSRALANQLFGGGYYQTWVPYAVDVNCVYNGTSVSGTISYEFTNRNVDFEMNAIMADASVSSRASAEARGYISQIDSILSAIIRTGMTEREKLLAIHDWIIANAAYDLDYANNEESFHSYGILNNGVAVCQGYAELFYYMANRAGIKCDTVSGEGNGASGWESHMWNVVYLSGDDTPYYIDVTFDDPLPDTTTGRTDYFMISEQAMSADHRW